MCCQVSDVFELCRTKQDERGLRPHKSSKYRQRWQRCEAGNNYRRQGSTILSIDENKHN